MRLTIKITVLSLSYFLLNCNVMKDDIYNQSDKADLVFKNGKIYTMNFEQNKRPALAIKAGKIVHIATNQETFLTFQQWNSMKLSIKF